MNDLDTAILSAWNRVFPILRSDPPELVRRLARRRQVLLTRAPRAWCVAVRASDNRINIASACIVPEDALDDNEPGYPFPHEVTLDKRLCKRLCAPVHVDAWGEEWTHVAKRLGC